CSPGSLPVRAVISAASKSMMMPSLSVVQTVPSCPKKGALFAPEAIGAVEQARLEGFEAHWHFGQPPAQLLNHAVNHAGADQRLAHRRRRAPAGPVGKLVANRHRQVMIRAQQLRRRCHNPLAPPAWFQNLEEKFAKH